MTNDFYESVFQTRAIVAYRNQEITPGILEIDFSYIPQVLLHKMSLVNNGKDILPLANICYLNLKCIAS
jgi:hypothetical protein